MILYVLSSPDEHCLVLTTSEAVKDKATEDNNIIEIQEVDFDKVKTVFIDLKFD